MGLYRSMAGTVRVSVTSADIPGLLAVFARENIPLMNVVPDGDLDIQFEVFRENYRKVREICKNRGDSLMIRGKNGVYWLGKSLLKRPVLMLGCFLLLLFLLWLPTRVFFVRVEGNSVIPARKILAAAEECGIGFGANRRQVRSERMKNLLLEAVPELQWAGVNTYGCVAVISVREKTMQEQEAREYRVSSIVAACDGIIVSATATGGNLLCAPGQAVMEGQVLISGYTDCGLTLRATRAEGEVYAETMHHITVLSPAECIGRGDVTENNSFYSLVIGKKRINLWKDSGKRDTTCGRMYEEYYITLPGGFRLPVALVKETVTIYQTETAVCAPQDAMADFAGEYLLTRMIAGTVQNGRESVVLLGDVYRLDGIYLCREMIGREKAEEIGDYNG